LRQAFPGVEDALADKSPTPRSNGAGRDAKTISNPLIDVTPQASDVGGWADMDQDPQWTGLVDIFAELTAVFAHGAQKPLELSSLFSGPLTPVAFRWD